MVRVIFLSTRTGNCAAVNNSSTHVSEEGETKNKNKNIKLKNKSKAKDSENGYVVMNSLLNVIYMCVCVYSLYFKFWFLSCTL
jgi:hypothetical protein